MDIASCWKLIVGTGKFRCDCSSASLNDIEAWRREALGDAKLGGVR